MVNEKRRPDAVQGTGPGETETSDLIIPGGDDIAKFMRALFRDKPKELFILVWSLEDKRSGWFQDVDDAIEYVQGKAQDKVDMYVGGGLSPQDYGPHRRCPSDEIAGLVGLWLDVDIAHPVHQKQNLPPTEEDAMALVKAMGPRPTLVVHSGHGLQPWWLFHEPWLFQDDTDRDKAQKLLAAWNQTAIQRAHHKEWTLDATHDLSRLMRIPGTWNTKAEPVKACLLTWESDGSESYA